MRAMNEREAMASLEDAELIPLVQGSLAEIKRIRSQCLDRDIPVAVAAPPGRT